MEGENMKKLTEEIPGAEAIAPLFKGLDSNGIPIANTLALLFKQENLQGPVQGPVRSCDECGGEGCCDARTPKVIPLGDLVKKIEVDECSGDGCPPMDCTTCMIG